MKHSFEQNLKSFRLDYSKEVNSAPESDVSNYNRISSYSVFKELKEDMVEKQTKAEIQNQYAEKEKKWEAERKELKNEIEKLLKKVIHIIKLLISITLF